VSLDGPAAILAAASGHPAACAIAHRATAGIGASGPSPDADRTASASGSGTLT
jgi:hypothetical protein